jgi:hypothetical protein
MIFWLLLIAIAGGAVWLAYVLHKKDRESVSDAIGGGVAFFLVVGLLGGFFGGMILSSLSFAASAYEKTSDVTYTLAKDSQFAQKGSSLDVVIEEDGQLKGLKTDVTSVTTVPGEKNEIRIETYGRTAPWFVPWSTGTDHFVTVTQGK